MSAQQGFSAIERRPGWPAFAIAAMLAGAILFGGGGAEGAFNNGIILAASAVLLFGLFAGHWSGLRPLPRSALIPVLLILGFLLVGTAQLVPLPPHLWRAQPGRELAVSALQLVHAADAWRPLSLDPEATRRSMAAVLLPAAMMFAVIGATRREIALLLYTIIGCAVVSAVLGTLQVALRYPPWLTYYEGGNFGAAAGVFANVNHQAALLLVAILCVGISVRLSRPAPVPRPRGGSMRFNAAWLLVPIFVVIVFATGSRAGLLLVALAVAVSAVIGLGRASARLLTGVLLAVAVVAFVLAEVSPAGNNLPVGQSFLFSSDRRYAILPDVLFTLKQFWPVGSGLGTFAQVFAVNENLDIAGAEFVNHAHNDLLELLIETGLAGLVWLVVAVAAIIVRVTLVQLRDSIGGSSQAAIAWTGLFILILLGLHSLADYPLRTQAIAALAGIAAGLVFAPATAELPAKPALARRLAAFGIAILVGAVVAAEVLRMYAAQAEVRAGRGAAAVKVDPANGSGLAFAAEQQLVGHHLAGARALAASAIRQSPLTVRAVRVLALAEDLEHRQGMAAWRIASAMGWRDPPTQFWAMQQALANHEYATAAIRADALLRTSRDVGAARIGTIRTVAAYAPFRTELIRRLLLEPRWAAAYFIVPEAASDRELEGAYLTLTDLARAGAQITAQDARSTIQALINRRAYASAVSLDRLVSRRGSNSAAARLNFDQSADRYVFDVTPFDWNIVNGVGTVTSVEQSGSRRVLVLGTDGRHQYQPVRKYLALAPGAYSLGYSMQGDPESAAALRIAVYCAGSKVPLATSSSDPLQGLDFVRRDLRFTLAASCPLVLLAFEAMPAERPVEAQFADLSLGRVDADMSVEAGGMSDNGTN
jgi:O-antigen ligase/polysaccharide polymerase Wzy-like membrane protein